MNWSFLFSASATKWKKKYKRDSMINDVIVARTTSCGNKKRKVFFVLKFQSIFHIWVLTHGGLKFFKPFKSFSLVFTHLPNTFFVWSFFVLFFLLFFAFFIVCDDTDVCVRACCFCFIFVRFHLCFFFFYYSSAFSIFLFYFLHVFFLFCLVSVVFLLFIHIMFLFFHVNFFGIWNIFFLCSTCFFMLF